MEYEGIWWLPNNKEKFYYGKLKINEFGDITLEFFDDPFASLEHKEYQIILGELKDDVKITLKKCSVLNNHQYLKNINLVKFNVIFAILGEHYLSEDQIKLDACRISYSNLNKFISKNSIYYRKINNSESKTKFPEISINIPNFCSIRIFFQSNLKDKIVFEIKSFRSQTIEDYIELKGIIQDFFNFVIKDNVLIEDIQYIKLNNLSHKEINHKVLYKSLHSLSDFFKPFNKGILFHYNDVSLRFEDIFQKWFILSFNLKHVYNLFTEVIYNTNQSNVYQFLMLSTALEVYHYYKMDNTSQIKNKKINHSNKIKEKVEACNNLNNYKKEKEDIINLIEKSVNLTFEERLYEIYNKYLEFTTKLFKFNNHKKAIPLIVQTRNYYTHYNPNKEEGKLEDEDLLYMTMDMLLLLRMCFLTELGFTLEEMKNIFVLDKINREPIQ